MSLNVVGWGVGRLIGGEVECDPSFVSNTGPWGRRSYRVFSLTWSFSLVPVGSWPPVTLYSSSRYGFNLDLPSLEWKLTPVVTYDGGYGMVCVKGYDLMLYCYHYVNFFRVQTLVDLNPILESKRLIAHTETGSRNWKDSKSQKEIFLLYLS